MKVKSTVGWAVALSMVPVLVVCAPFVFLGVFAMSVFEWGISDI